MTQTRAGGEPGVPQRSALERLLDFKAHQGSFARELKENWKGWLASLCFHGAFFTILALLTWSVIAPEAGPVTIQTAQFDPTPALDTEPLETLFPPAKFEAEKEGPPSLPAGGDKPSPAAAGLDLYGVPDDWIGRWGPQGPFGPGGPPGKELTGPLGDVLKDYKQLDVVFVFDSTGSMGGILLEVKTRIRQFTKVITYLVPNTQLGLVTYRDKKKYDLDDYEYTAKFMPLTKADPEGMERLSRFLRETEAYGGGDIPEAVYDGLQAAIEKMHWRKDSKKIIIVFGDAPPRPEDNGLAKVYDLVRAWHENTGGTVSCIDTTGSSKLLDEFRQMAVDGGGQSCFLNDERAIIRQLVVYVFPKNVEEEIRRIYTDILGKDKDEIQEK